MRGEGAGVQVGAERVGGRQRPGEGQPRRMGLRACLLPLAPLRPTVLEPNLQGRDSPGVGAGLGPAGARGASLPVPLTAGPGLLSTAACAHLGPLWPPVVQGHLRDQT